MTHDEPKNCYQAELQIKVADENGVLTGQIIRSVVYSNGYGETTMADGQQPKITHYNKLSRKPTENILDELWKHDGVYGEYVLTIASVERTLMRATAKYVKNADGKKVPKNCR